MAHDLDDHLPGILAGDAGAFGRWLAGAEPRVRASLASFAARLDAEAVLQEALLRTWQVAPRLEPDGRPNGLLRLAIRIARNAAVSELRAHGREDAADEADLARHLEAAVAPALPDPFLRRLIAACRAALPRQPRAALDARLAAAGGEPDAGIARRLRMRPNTFLQNVARARRALAACLKAGGVDLEALP